MATKPRKLMIVESPKKCKPISSYLSSIDPDSKWDVLASVGHIQDLNSDKKGKFGSLGINKETLEMDYQLSQKGTDVVKTLQKMIKENDYQRIVIATDSDREGEAIAEHLRIRLKLKDKDYDRCTFNEITKTAVEKSLNAPRKVNKDLIKAQDSRRILDRVVGWEAGSAVGRAMNQKTPMGRVISQAVKMVVMRERERNAFVQKEHYGVKITIDNWTADLDLKQSDLLDDDAEDNYWQDKPLAEKIAAALEGATLGVIDSSKELKERFAPPPFETATMHQAAANTLGWVAKKCDNIAQKLYQESHITYIRTDSTVISDDAFVALQQYGKANGLNVVEKKREGKKGKVDQEAHECIRPSNFDFDGTGLDADDKLLYDLIRTRCIASQLEASIYEVVALTLATDDDKIFKASGSIMIDKGWRVLLDGDDSEEEEVDASSTNPVPLKNKGDEVVASKSELLIKKTQKPPRLTQSTLGAMLTKYGIARPSSYANIYEKIGEKHHGYVSVKGKFYEPSEHAEKMVAITEDDLCIMDAAFTMSMEDHLDDIANGKIEGNAYIFDFFERLGENLDSILKKHTKPDSKCLECGEQTLRRIGKKDGKGFFWGCRNTECKKSFSDKDGKPIDGDKEFLNEDGTPMFPCPKCKKHLIRIPSKKSKKLWWICSDKTRECGFIAGNNDKGEPDFEAQKSREEWEKKVADAHDADGKPLFPCPVCDKALIKGMSKSEKLYFRCSARKADCDFFTMADDEGNPKEK